MTISSGRRPAMEEKTPSLVQVQAISQAEFLISQLYEAPDYMFQGIIETVDKSGLAELADWMQYLYSLLVARGYLDYAEKFANKYNIEKIKKIEKPSPLLTEGKDTTIP
jgi:hypothetical protein